MFQSKMMLRLMVLGLCFYAQNGFSAEVIKGQNIAMQARLSNSPSAWANAVGLGKLDELREVSSRTDKSGQKHTRFQQHFNGIPVFGKHLIEHSGRKNSPKRFTGKLIKQIHADISVHNKGMKNNNEALKHAKSLYESSVTNAGGLKYEDESIKLVIMLDGNDVAHKAFHVTFMVNSANGNDPAMPSYLLDANTLRVLNQWDNLQTADIGTGPGGNEKTGIYEYGTDFGFLDVLPGEVGTNCEMINSNVKTVNLNHETSGSDIHSYECPRNTVKQINGAYSPLNDAHYFGGVVYDMFNDWYGMPPLTFQLEMRVHFGTDFQNAFWNGSSMTFGDGGSIFYPLVSLDVSAHEVAHGFTQQNSSLIYSSQSGGMNEAFSDMTGEAAEFYSRNSNDWQLGAEIFKGTGALRYMDDPTLDGISTGHIDGYYEGMDVHHSSGIYNKAFYLLATTSGWGVQKAFDTMVTANMNYWTPDSTFAEGVCGVISAAEDLSYDSNAVVTVFSQVGLTCGVEPTQAAPIVTSFANGVRPFVGITGENLVSVTAVTFGGTPTGYQFNSPTSLTAIKPASFTTGPICVTNSGGTGCSPGPYYGQPVIKSYSQSTGPFVGITGNNLTGVISVTFNGVPAMGYQENGLTQLAAITPLNVTYGPICVTTRGGSTCSTFDYMGTLPQITSVVHGTGPFYAINGINLVNVTAATFNGVPVAGWQSNGENQLSALVFNGGAGPVTVTTGAGFASFNYVP